MHEARVRRTLLGEGCPATVALMVAGLALFMAVRLAPDATANWLLFDPRRWLLRPWTLLTGSILCADVLSLLFSLAWLWWIGGSLERSYGTRTFLGLWAAISAVTGLALAAAAGLGENSGTILMFAVLDALTVAWGIQNRDMVILLMGVIPLRGITLAWLSPLFVLATYPWFPTCIFALAGCGLAWGFVAYRRRRWRYAGVTRIPRNRHRATDAPQGLFGRFKSWQRNRRLQRLLRNSGIDDRNPSRR
jgi:membrane associated rhomboid family serine protease